MSTQLWSPPSLEECENAVGDEAPRWAGRCHEIACALHRHFDIPGRPQYGHYYGPVAPSSVFADHPHPRHGWVMLNDGRIFDPTRWAFETPELPYLFCGPDDQNFYDLGGQRLREVYGLGDRERPGLDADARMVELRGMPRDAQDYIAALVQDFKRSEKGVLEVNLRQCGWLANLPLHALVEVSATGRKADHAPALYRAIVDAGRGAHIPIDLRTEKIGRYGYSGA